MPPVKLVFAAANCAAVDADGAAVTLVQGEPWAADDPFVKLHKDLFSSEPPAPRFPRRTVHVVESLTAGPNERRTSNRG